MEGRSARFTGEMGLPCLKTTHSLETGKWGQKEQKRQGQGRAAWRLGLTHHPLPQALLGVGPPGHPAPGPGPGPGPAPGPARQGESQPRAPGA